MNQSSFIAGFLLAGFILFLATNNRLSAYTAVLWGTPSASGSGSNSSGPVSTPATQNQTSAAPSASTSASIQSSGLNLSGIFNTAVKFFEGTLFP